MSRCHAEAARGRCFLSLKMLLFVLERLLQHRLLGSKQKVRSSFHSGTEQDGELPQHMLYIAEITVNSCFITWQQRHVFSVWRRRRCQPVIVLQSCAHSFPANVDIKAKMQTIESACRKLTEKKKIWKKKKFLLHIAHLLFINIKSADFYGWKLCVYTYMIDSWNYTQCFCLL